MVEKHRKSITRAARMMQLGAGIAGSYLAYQLQRPFLDPEESRSRRQGLRRRNASRVREGLQDLRGPLMKVGQALSMQTHALGPEWITELSNLQMQAPAMHPTLMRAQFKSAFGKEPEEVFGSFEPKPFAAASLGQVHWATTRAGEAVAVKVQYPAIREAIESDFRLLTTAGMAARLTGHLQASVVREAKRGILEETDYLREARNIGHFATGLAPLRFMRVPKVHAELTCDQVLTMSRVEGLRMQEFLAARPPQALRDEIGAALVRLFFFQLVRMRALHADPHPGNYLFKSDGTIGLIDFGCVKFLKPEVVRCYSQFWLREWRQDDRLYGEIIRVVFGDRKSAQDRFVRRNMEEIMRFYDEFHPMVDPPRLLDFGDPRFMDCLTQLAKTLLLNKFLSPDFLFLSRAESGILNLLHMLKARVRTTQIAREFITKTKPGQIP